MIDTETEEIKVKKLAHTKEDFNDFIGDRAGTRMVIESCRDWSRTYELSEDLVEEIILAHPLKALNTLVYWLFFLLFLKLKRKIRRQPERMVNLKPDIGNLIAFMVEQRYQ